MLTADLECYGWKHSKAGSRCASGPIGAVVFGSDQGLVGQFNDVVADLAVKSLAALTATPVTQCDGRLKKGADAKSEGSGCLILLVGLLLSPILIGIPIILYGLHLTSKREDFWRWRKCGAKYDREIKWYEFG